MSNNILYNGLKRIKNILLPGKSQYRKLPFGIVSGIIMKIDFHHQMRQYLGLYENEVRPYLIKLIKKEYNCFDIGSNNGYYALIMAKLSRGKILSVECDSQMAQQLIETYKKNSFDITLANCFISNIIDNNNKTIDWCAQQFFTPDFIKMDIEGGEVNALEGAVHTLETRKPHMIIETHGIELEQQCIKILEQFKYSPIIVEQSNSLFKEKRETFTHNRWLIAEGNA